MRLLSFHRAAKMLTLITAAAAVFVTTAGAAPRVQRDRTTVVGYASEFYGYDSGTSFASPEVAGAAALVWAANPGLSATDVAAVLKEAAAGNNGVWNSHTGFGRLDAAAAVARAQALLTSPPVVILSGKRKGTHVDLSFVRARFAGSIDLAATTSSGVSIRVR